MTDSAPRSLKVWDPVIRVFHWGLVGSFAVAWITAEEWDQVHEWAGYTALGLIAVRLAWGLTGPRYARFSQFVRGPGTIGAYVGKLFSGREPRYIGHNPLGGLMAMALIAAMVLTGVSGWMMTLDAFWGLEWVEETHEALANGMLVLVAIHVAGVVFESLRHGENLVHAMIDGRKRPATPEDIA